MIDAQSAVVLEIRMLPLGVFKLLEPDLMFHASEPDDAPYSGMTA